MIREHRDTAGVGARPPLGDLDRIRAPAGAYVTKAWLSGMSPDGLISGAVVASTVVELVAGDEEEEEVVARVEVGIPSVVVVGVTELGPRNHTLRALCNYRRRKPGECVA